LNLEQRLKALDFHFSNEEYEKLRGYSELLKTWGKTHNLSAKLDDEFINFNIIDSLYPLKFLGDFKNIADLGSGAGFPALILAILLKKSNFTLFEPRLKRASFLSFVKNKLDLENVEIVAKKVQDFSCKLSYDLLISRALSNTALLFKLTKHISDENSAYLFYKGTNLEEELKNLEVKIKTYEIITSKNSENRKYLYIKKR